LKVPWPPLKICVNLRNLWIIFFFLLLLGSCRPRPKPSEWNVIWISMDDVKATSLGCYGRARDTSPNLDKLARQGVRFEWCITQASWTLPSYASMLTSRYPFETVMTREYLRHLQGETEVARSRDPFRMPEMNRHWYGKLRPEVTTLAELLRRAGLSTAAWTNNQWLAPSLSGLDRGFEEYYFTDQPDKLYLPADATVEEVIAWIERHREKRFFVFVHLMDPHKPWQNHPEFGFGNRPLDIYESQIRFADQAIGQMVERLQQLQLWERTLLVVNSDHGEGVYEEKERFVGHGGGVAADLIRVPLILVGPNLSRGKVIGDTVRNLDVMPTVLDLLQVAADVELRGKSLAPLWSPGAAAGPEQYLPAVTMAMMKGPEQISVITRRWQVVLIPAYESVQVHPWPGAERAAAAPAETQDQAVAFARKFVEEEIAALGKETLPAPVNLDPETEKKLKALGYLP